MKFAVLSLAAVAALAISVGTASAQYGYGYGVPAGGPVVVGSVPLVPNYSGYLYPNYNYGYSSIPTPSVNLVIGAGGVSPLYGYGSGYGYGRPYYSGYYGGYGNGYYGGYRHHHGRRW